RPAADSRYEERAGRPLEPLELYTQKSGEEIVQQLYTFRDKGDREIALRPEMTPTLARMVAPPARAELTAAATDILRAWGLGPQGVHARLSDRRVLRALLLGHGVAESQ